MLRRAETSVGMMQYTTRLVRRVCAGHVCKPHHCSTSVSWPVGCWSGVGVHRRDHQLRCSHREADGSGKDERGGPKGADLVGSDRHERVVVACQRVPGSKSRWDIIRVATSGQRFRADSLIRDSRLEVRLKMFLLFRLFVVHVPQGSQASVDVNMYTLIARGHGRSRYFNTLLLQQAHAILCLSIFVHTT